MTNIKYKYLILIFMFIIFYSLGQSWTSENLDCRTIRWVINKPSPPSKACFKKIREKVRPKLQNQTYCGLLLPVEISTERREIWNFAEHFRPNHLPSLRGSLTFMSELWLIFLLNWNEREWTWLIFLVNLIFSSFEFKQIWALWQKYQRSL